MSEPDLSSLLGAGVDDLFAVADRVWSAALENAFSAPADADLATTVPEMTDTPDVDEASAQDDDLVLTDDDSGIKHADAAHHGESVHNNDFDYDSGHLEQGSADPDLGYSDVEHDPGSHDVGSHDDLDSHHADDGGLG